MSAPGAVRAGYERGWSVIPCGLDRKALVRWQRYQHERLTAEQLEQWLRSDPPCWAVITGELSGIVALDFTQKGEQRWRNGLPANVRTPRGGSHVYVAHPGHKVDTLNEHSKRELGACFPGTDVRGDGGYAVFAGRSQFGEYEVGSFEPISADVLPVGLRSLVDGHFELIVQALKRVNGGSGGRNDVGFWLACQLRDARLPQAEVETLVRIYAGAVPLGDHAYEDSEVRDSVASAFGGAPRDPPSFNNGAASTDWLAGVPMDPCAEPPEPAPLIPGFPFLHAGMAATISGPTGAGRSMVIEACAYDAAREGVRVAYLGGEVTEDEFHARAALLADKRGDDRDQVRPELSSARYLDLVNTLLVAWKKPRDWIEAVAPRYDVVVIDPLNAALAATESKHENADYITFYVRLVEPLREHGVAVVMLDNVGHAEDAQERPIGPSAKRHKTDLEFACQAQEQPPLLRITAKKVRSIRASFRKGASWECDEATQSVLRVDDVRAQKRAPSRRDQVRRQRRELLLGVLLKGCPNAQTPKDWATGHPLGEQSEVALSKATEIPRSTLQRVLKELEDEGYAVQGEGWELTEEGCALARSLDPPKQGEEEEEKLA